MTDKEILQKAIERAEKNGFVFNMSFTLRNYPEDILSQRKYYSFIFDHNFAKAFFTDDKKKYKEHIYARTIEMRHWEYHLQVMVLEPEPLQYIAKFLEE